MQFIEITIERKSNILESICNFINYPRSFRIRYYPTDKFSILSENGEKKELLCPNVNYQYIDSNCYNGPKGCETPMVLLSTTCKMCIGYTFNRFVGFNGYSTILKRRTHDRYTKDNDTEFSREVFRNNSQEVIPSVYNSAFLTYNTDTPNTQTTTSEEPVTKSAIQNYDNNNLMVWNGCGYSPIIHVGCLEETYKMGRYSIAYDPTIVDETNLHYLIHWYFTHWIY